MCKDYFRNKTVASDNVNSAKQELIPPTSILSETRIPGALSEDQNMTSVRWHEKLVLSSALKCLMVFDTTRPGDAETAEKKEK